LALSASTNKKKTTRDVPIAPVAPRLAFSSLSQNRGNNIKCQGFNFFPTEQYVRSLFIDVEIRLD